LQELTGDPNDVEENDAMMERSEKPYDMIRAAEATIAKTSTMDCFPQIPEPQFINLKYSKSCQLKIIPRRDFVEMCPSTNSRSSSGHSVQKCTKAGCTMSGGAVVINPDARTIKTPEFRNCMQSGSVWASAVCKGPEDCAGKFQFNGFDHSTASNNRGVNKEITSISSMPISAYSTW
jgi:hypothetical protein